MEQKTDIITNPGAISVPDGYPAGSNPAISDYVDFIRQQTQQLQSNLEYTGIDAQTAQILAVCAVTIVVVAGVAMVVALA